MAIDSAIKRNSAMLEPGNMPWPPDGALTDETDRMVMLEFYSGISVGSPGPPTWGVITRALPRRRIARALPR